MTVTNKREKITFLCEKDLRNLLESLAKQDGRSLSSFIERTLAAALVEQVGRKVNCK